jgi:long-subunit fatty acid transport protein
MRTIKILAALCLMTACVTAFAQDDKAHETIVLGGEIAPKDSTKTRRFKNHLIAPKGGWQCGISVMYADFSSGNSEYMMLLQGIDANASMLRLAPQAAYTFMDNHAVGIMFRYTNFNGVLDAATADLLGNLSMTLEDVNASSRGLSAMVIQRTYWGLDKNGRIGLFWDYILGYTRKNSRFFTGEKSSAYTTNDKIHIGFAPGIVYFPMNNVSIQASICLADLSYNNVRAYDGIMKVGVRHAWKAQASLNVLDLNFGLAIHF